MRPLYRRVRPAFRPSVINLGCMECRDVLYIPPLAEVYVHIGWLS